MQTATLLMDAATATTPKQAVAPSPCNGRERPTVYVSTVTLAPGAQLTLVDGPWGSATFPADISLREAARRYYDPA